MARVYVSLGSNIEPEKNIRSAICALRAVFGALTLSSVYRTEAYGFIGDDFYNLVAGFTTEQTPEQIVARLDEIERAHGRVRGAPRFSARSLDIDLLLYDDLILRDRGLNVPRPEIQLHAFVLGPLAEIAPQTRHPETGATLGAMWERFASSYKPLRPVAFDFANS